LPIVEMASEFFAKCLHFGKTRNGTDLRRTLYFVKMQNGQIYL
jgi:hypothetical protein